jgi:hypothetical protein
MNPAKIHVLGVTGTTQGATRAQWQRLWHYLGRPGFTRLVHGGARGVDLEAHDIWLKYGKAAPTVYRPGPGESPLVRDHIIAEEPGLLLVVPHTDHEYRRAGEWATYRYARKANTPTVIIWPDGSILKEGQ